MWGSYVLAGPATATPIKDPISVPLDASKILATRRIRRDHCGPGPVRRRKMATLAWRLAGDAATATAGDVHAHCRISHTAMTAHRPQQAYIQVTSPRKWRNVPGVGDMGRGRTDATRRTGP